MRLILLLIGCTLALLSPEVMAALPSLKAVSVTADPAGGQTYSVSLQVLAVMTVLTFLPAVFMMMTSFTRIIIVLAMLRQAVGLTTTHTNQILIGLSLFLTLFVMTPVFNQVNADALQPYLSEKISTEQAIEKAKLPFQHFMLSQTRSDDLTMFTKLSGKDTYETAEQVPFTVLIPSFVTSELKTAFQFGFLLFLPFLIIDLVVASVLMSMGMMMLSPLIISLPFKVMLFVLVDGWSLVMGTLASSFGTF